MTYAFALENLADSRAARMGAEIGWLEASNATAAKPLKDNLLAASVMEKDDLEALHSLCVRNVQIIEDRCKVLYFHPYHFLLCFLFRCSKRSVRW